MTDKRFIVPNGIYLASHSVGAATVLGQQAHEKYFVTPWNRKAGEGWQNWLALIDDFCGELAGLLGGKADDFCPQPNLSAALTKYLTSLPAPKARNKIVMHSNAFPSMGFVAKALETRGYELSLIAPELPAHDPDVWSGALDHQTACALITHVHSNTGILSPTADIIRVCRSGDAFTIIDTAQSAGIIPIDLNAWNADVVLGSCVKWLCGGPGAGFMWINPSHIDELEPEDVGWFSHENPFEFDIRNFRYAAGARKFWGGTPSISPYAFALGGLRTITKIGVKNIRAHNIELMKIVHPGVNPAINGGTLCLPITDDVDAKLTAEGCQFDRRGDIARLSFHIYNTIDEAMRVSEILTPSG